VSQIVVAVIVTNHEDCDGQTDESVAAAVHVQWATRWPRLRHFLNCRGLHSIECKRATRRNVWPLGRESNPGVLTAVLLRHLNHQSKSYRHTLP